MYRDLASVLGDDEVQLRLATDGFGPLARDLHDHAWADA